MIAALRKRLFGEAIRSIRTNGPPTVHLTFDDGPHPVATPRVLDCLRVHEARATFFVVAEQALGEPALLARMRAEGHALGNHSLDHRYGAFFGGRARMRDWVERSERALTQAWGEPPVGFRPPVGIRTPELAAVLRELNLPMVLWNERFYDRARRWTRARASESARRLEAGSIVLLHDTNGVDDDFLGTLAFYLEALKARGFALEAIQRLHL